jgi:tetratricopeptide (TPR) repeat protein
VETFKFMFWEAMKTLSLALLGLLAAKAVGGLKDDGVRDRQLVWVRRALYASTLVLVMLGAEGVGKDLAARFYFWASQGNLAHFETSGVYPEASKAYANALRAVELRPGNLSYWRLLARSKFSQQQFRSMLRDQPAFEALSEGHLDEEDALRFAFAHLFLAEDDKVIPLTRQIIRENRFYAEPYVLEGIAYADQKKYAEAERTFLEVLQMFPTQEGAVRGLAQVYFLTGNRARALAVLGETDKFSFSPEARKRFADLKALYSQ